MFEYFPGHYTWSMPVMSALGMGGEISEIDKALKPLKDVVAQGDAPARQQAFEAWHGLGEHLEALARRDEEADHPLSAGRKYLRASVYYFTAEMFLTIASPEKLPAYRRMLETFEKGVSLSGANVEFVEVPFEGSSLPALFVPAETVEERAPCIIHFDGADWMKEPIWFATRDDLARRGVSMLIVDHPGVGGAIRLRNLPLRYNTEVPAAACVDYLETRDDIDPERIGIMALSAGGYYAPRCAAFEKRLKLCVAWGAQWSKRACQEHEREMRTESNPDQDFHTQWMFGASDAVEKEDMLDLFTLEGVADKIECPLLIVHGENDRQIPLWHAERTIEEAVNAPERELKVATLDEGGAEHCGIDNLSMVTDYCFDWIQERFVQQAAVAAA